MFKTKLSALVAGAALLLGASGAANALTLTAGNYKIIFDNYDSGTLGYGNTAGTVCTTVAGCDAAAALPAPGSVGSSNTSADTMGILSVASITNLSNGQTQYIRGTASVLGGVSVGPYLTGVFGNLEDYNVSVGTIGTNTFTSANALGGSFRIFSNTSDWDPTLGPTGGGDLNALNYAPSISGGSLFLGGNFVTGVIGGDTTTTYTTLYNNASIAGNGSGFLDFTEGSALPFFATQSLTDLNGTKRDAFLTTTFDDVNGVASSLGWTVKSSGQVSGALIPEPGSLALVSLALLGLGLSTRRRGTKI